MKSPDEIKKGLECCMGDPLVWHCEECPYADDGAEADDGCDYNGAQVMQDALALIQQLEAKVPRWISVEERLPEKAGAYVVYGVGRIAFATFYPSIQMWVSNVDAGITHWMPLPEPPEEENNNGKE